MAFRDSQQRLTDALEVDLRGILVVRPRRIFWWSANRAYGEILLSRLPGMPSRGTPFETIVRNAAEQGMVDGAKGRAAEWIADRVARHRSPGEPHVQRRAGGRWIQINERKTAEGGTGRRLYGHHRNQERRGRDLVRPTARAQSWPTL